MRRLTNLLPHQEIAFKKIAKNKVGALFMEMGTGKTRTVIEILNDKIERNKINKILYCCPFSIINNVKEQFLMHCPDMLNITKICGIESLSLSNNLYLDILKYVDDKTAMIVDESTLIKNYGAKRSKRIINIGEACKYRYILSGNPVPRNIADLFSQLFFLSPAILEYTSWYEFSREHIIFDDKYKGRIRRTKNEDYIAEKMQPYVFQIKKSECLKLPEKNFENRYCSSSRDEYIEYKNIKERYFEIILENPNGMDFCAMLLELLHFSATIKSRIDLLKKVIDEINLNDNKIIIFCRHLDIQEEVFNSLKDNYCVYSVNGKTKKRESILNDFKKNGQILILNYGIGSYGLNLQEANYAIYYENIFDYGLLEQSESRIHRFGQDKKCYYITFTSDLKIEDLVNTNITKKINTIKWFEEEIRKVNLCEEKDKRLYLRRIFEEVL